jgi:hypothetical protein
VACGQDALGSPKQQATPLRPLNPLGGVAPSSAMAVGSNGLPLFSPGAPGSPGSSAAGAASAGGADKRATGPKPETKHTTVGALPSLDSPTRG